MQFDQNSTFQILLQECTLRLNSQDDYGTGFFVAPGFVLTCKHVIGKSHRGSFIKANWNGKEVAAKVVSFLENYDIALLSVDLVNHPCVLLDKQEVEIGQRLYTYGYPDKERDGASASPKSEGLSDKGRLLTLSGSNIRSGFSGSPILNIKTQKICGMTAKDRQRQILGTGVTEPIGGQAIPADIIISSWHELISNTCEIDFIFNSKLIGVLGIFADCIALEQNFVNPWTINATMLLPTQSLNHIILKWARNVHFSFLWLDMNTIEETLRNITTEANLKPEELYNYFSIPSSDMRFNIVSEFAKENYIARAPFEHCVYQFLFLCTNNCMFIDMIDAENVRKKFIEFAKYFIIRKICKLYVNENQRI